MAESNQRNAGAGVENPLLSFKISYFNFYRRNRENIEGWIIVGPILAYCLIFIFLPLFAVILLSMTRWNGVMGLPEWIGIDNFKEIFSYENYMLSFKNTIVMGMSSLAGTFILGFLIALLMNNTIKGIGVFRALWYVPVITSGAIMAKMWLSFLNYNSGIFNSVIRLFSGEAINWLNEPFWATLWIIVFSIWKSVGGTVVLFLAGLQGIDKTLYEAAYVDGAYGIKIVRYITIPLLKPMILFILITGIIGSFQIFEPVQLITNGGPFNSTNVIFYEIYKDAFMNFNMGTASALSMIILIVTMSVSVIQLKLFKE